VALSSCFNELARLSGQLEEIEKPSDQVDLLITSIAAEIQLVKALIS